MRNLIRITRIRLRSFLREQLTTQQRTAQTCREVVRRLHRLLCRTRRRLQPVEVGEVRLQVVVRLLLLLIEPVDGIGQLRLVELIVSTTRITGLLQIEVILSRERRGESQQSQLLLALGVDVLQRAVLIVLEPLRTDVLRVQVRREIAPLRVVERSCADLLTGETCLQVSLLPRLEALRADLLAL